MIKSLISERGCQIIAEQSGHVVAIDQPGVVVMSQEGGTVFPAAHLRLHSRGQSARQLAQG